MLGLKKMAIAAIPALALTFAAASGAQAQDVQCAPKDVMVEAVKQQFGDIATGYKGSNEAWDFEVYADPADGSWSLIGEPKGDGVPKGLGCYLGGGASGYTDQVKSQNRHKQIIAPAP